jgi:hypothetical protein
MPINPSWIRSLAPRFPVAANADEGIKVGHATAAAARAERRKKSRRFIGGESLRCWQGETA